MIKIDPELRERGEKHAARISVKDQIFVTAEMYFNAVETLGELINVIASHECPVSGVVSDELRHRIWKIATYCRHHDFSQWAEDLQELLFIANRKGPDSDLNAELKVENDELRQQLVDTKPDWGNKLLRKKDVEIERLKKGHVVECCEFGRREFFWHGGHWWIHSPLGRRTLADFCICGTKLPELGEE